MAEIGLFVHRNGEQLAIAVDNLGTQPQFRWGSMTENPSHPSDDCSPR
jgi:hypothetical protein